MLKKKMLISWIAIISLPILIFSGIIVAKVTRVPMMTKEHAFSEVSPEGANSKATFAGGCFWCMEDPFESHTGVLEVLTGYAGGDFPDPSYKLVASGKTDHREVVQITFDPSLISYQKLLDIFWQQIDPTDYGGQFADRGSQYTTAIFYHDEEQKLLAQQSKEKLTQNKQFEKPIVTKIIAYKNFYPAEEYHQNYYQKMPAYYKHYKEFSGRAPFLRKFWSQTSASTADRLKSNSKYGKVDLAQAKKKLTELQYTVTQENGTERPFHNEYWNHKQAGIYVDIVSGEPLFSSLDKFDSGTGWPSFTKPLVQENVYEKKDFDHGLERTEVRSTYANSHLGHVFNDGPAPTGLRYCINSAALRFIPQEKLKSAGYEMFLDLFPAAK